LFGCRTGNPACPDRRDRLSYNVPAVIPNGIDFEMWRASDSDRARAAAWRAANVEDRVVLGFFGHLKAKKGVPFFIDALQRSGLDDRVHLLLVGDSESIVADGLAQTRVTTIDRFDLIPFYLASDFVVLPSHYDGFPNVLIEAASLGKPLLASRAGGMRDLLTDGDDSFLFDPGDEHACRAAIHRAMAAPPERVAAMGANAERVARERCDAHGEAARYRDVLDDVRRRSHAQNDRRSGARRSRFVQ
jgi:glycosyltransferase involved in cell wall biosynthesis